MLAGVEEQLQRVDRELARRQPLDPSRLAAELCLIGQIKLLYTQFLLCSVVICTIEMDNPPFSIDILFKIILVAVTISTYYESSFISIILLKMIIPLTN